MTVTIARRTVIKGIGALSVGLPSRQSRESLDVGIYVAKVTTDNTPDRYLNDACQNLSKWLRRTFPTAELSVGPEGVVEVPQDVAESPKELNRWWRRQDVWDCEDSNILVMPYQYPGWEETHGYADINGKTAVATMNSWTIAHEVGHTLGARHRHSEKWTENDEVHATFMVPDGRDVDVFEPRFSERAVKAMK